MAAHRRSRRLATSLRRRLRTGAAVATASILLASLVATTTGIDTAGASGFSTAVEVSAPTPFQITNPFGYLRSTSCWSAGDCTAVGEYYDGSSETQAMFVTETNGSFGTASEITAPSNAQANPDAFLYGVSCASAGDCTAVGFYHDSSGYIEGMFATETNGSFAQATEVTAPSNAQTNPDAFFHGVSCWSAGNCTAVGDYDDNSANTQSMVATETAGSFAQATEVTAPTPSTANPFANLQAVSCAGTENCTAVGQYRDGSSDFQAMYVIETNGTFAQEMKVTSPSPFASNPEGVLNAVSCLTTTSCVAVGDYEDGSTNTQAMSAAQSGTSFTTASEITAPSNAQANPVDTLNGLSCVSATNCTAVGSYSDNSGNTQAMSTAQSGASFAQGTEITAPSPSATNPLAAVLGVSCASSGNCTAVGNYNDGLGKTQAMGISEVATTVPGAPGIGTATAGNASASVSFTSPSSNGGSAITGYKVTAVDSTNSANGGESATGTSSPITVSGLTNGDSYTFSVTASNGNGTGPASGASNAVTPATTPGTPTNVTASAANASATVTWNPPGSNGGSAITGYGVNAFDATNSANGGEFCSTTGTTTCTLSGLTNGDSYTFSVFAINAIGDSGNGVSNAVTPTSTATVPSPPTNVTATPGDASASVRFTAPTNIGGSAITKYTVTATDSTNTAHGGETMTGSSSPITVSGLTNGDRYTFTVTATNGVGTSLPSSASSAVTPETTCHARASGLTEEFTIGSACYDVSSFAASANGTNGTVEVSSGDSTLLKSILYDGLTKEKFDTTLSTVTSSGTVRATESLTDATVTSFTETDGSSTTGEFTLGYSKITESGETSQASSHDDLAQTTDASTDGVSSSPDTLSSTTCGGGRGDLSERLAIKTSGTGAQTKAGSTSHYDVCAFETSATGTNGMVEVSSGDSALLKSILFDEFDAKSSTVTLTTNNSHGDVVTTESLTDATVTSFTETSGSSTTGEFDLSYDKIEVTTPTPEGTATDSWSVTTEAAHDDLAQTTDASTDGVSSSPDTLSSTTCGGGRGDLSERLAIKTSGTGAQTKAGSTSHYDVCAFETSATGTNGMVEVSSGDSALLKSILFDEFDAKSSTVTLTTNNSHGDVVTTESLTDATVTSFTETSGSSTTGEFDLSYDKIEVTTPTPEGTATDSWSVTTEAAHDDLAQTTDASTDGVSSSPDTLSSTTCGGGRGDLSERLAIKTSGTGAQTKAGSTSHYDVCAFETSATGTNGMVEVSSGDSALLKSILFDEFDAKSSTVTLTTNNSHGDVVTTESLTDATVTSFTETSGSSTTGEFDLSYDKIEVTTPTPEGTATDSWSVTTEAAHDDLAQTTDASTDGVSSSPDTLSSTTCGGGRGDLSERLAIKTSGTGAQTKAGSTSHYDVCAFETSATGTNGMVEVSSGDSALLKSILFDEFDAKSSTVTLTTNNSHGDVVTTESLTDATVTSFTETSGSSTTGEFDLSYDKIEVTTPTPEGTATDSWSVTTEAAHDDLAQTTDASTDGVSSSPDTLSSTTCGGGRGDLSERLAIKTSGTGAQTKAGSTSHYDVCAFETSATGTNGMVEVSSGDSALLKSILFDEFDAKSSTVTLTTNNSHGDVVTTESLTDATVTSFTETSGSSTTGEFDLSYDKIEVTTPTPEGTATDSWSVTA